MGQAGQQEKAQAAIAAVGDIIYDESGRPGAYTVETVLVALLEALRAMHLDLSAKVDTVDTKVDDLSAKVDAVDNRVSDLRHDIEETVRLVAPGSDRLTGTERPG